jgi:3-dehydroquinate synthase
VPSLRPMITAEALYTEDSLALPEPSAFVEGRAERADRYPIVVTRSIEDAAEQVAELVDGHAAGLLTDSTVERLHGGAFLVALEEAGVVPEVAVVPAGEANKTLEQAARLWDWLAAGSLGRRDVLIALGGGVVNDLGGFVAAGYMRGMSYVNVATTLVGQVDAAIGGKLAVNHREAKNLIGGFHQPLGVVSHVGFLDTLDDRNLRAGLAETIKKALIASPAYWEFIERHAEDLLARDEDALERLVTAAGSIKAVLIARDPYEHDSRRTLGFGHALAHPIETITGYGPVLHGEAVAIGMVVEARLAHARGLLATADLERIVALLRRVGLPTTAADLAVPIDAGALVRATEKVRLARGGALRWVLPLGLGRTAIVDAVADSELGAALGACGIG